MTAPTLLGVDRSWMGRRWVARPAADAQVQSLVRDHDLDDVTARVLASRGITEHEAGRFLHPTLKDLMPDPLRLADMEAAVTRLVSAIKRGERIAVFGDYDVDGATSGALLLRFLRHLGLDALSYVPDRMTEGYGPNPKAMSHLKDQGADIVITVDCGITAFDALQTAADAGLDVIVLDHHKADASLPAGVAIVNPNRIDDTSGLGHLAAVGVTFMLVVGLNRALREDGFYSGDKKEPDLTHWLDLVALGTVCDVVPLKGLNRAFVRRGLDVLNKAQNAGLSAVARTAGSQAPFDAQSLGFVFGPRVNASGRVGDPSLGTKLLSTEDPAEAAGLALKLEEHNQARKEIEAHVLMQAIEQVETNGLEEKPLILVAGDDWHPGVIGIVAGRLKDRYHRPTVVVAKDGGMAKGSARSIPGVDIGAAVLAASEADLLINGGGHPMAAGMTAMADDLQNLSAFLEKEVEDQTQGDRPAAEWLADGLVTVRGATPGLVTQLAALGPYGSENPEPRFVVAGAEVVHSDIVGTGHVRCMLADQTGARLKAIAFRAADSDLGVGLLNTMGASVHVAGTLSIDRWQGREQAQLIIEDAAPA